jgi:hypothetical protein
MLDQEGHSECKGRNFWKHSDRLRFLVDHMPDMCVKVGLMFKGKLLV